MKKATLGALAAVLGCAGPALAHEPHGGGGSWWRGSCQEQFLHDRCEVKLESKRGEFKREIKCPDGVGADWNGEWKREYRDGPCLVKIDAKRDEYKEEIKCE
jgi:hypothetical protein